MSAELSPDFPLADFLLGQELVLAVAAVAVCGVSAVVVHDRVAWAGGAIAGMIAGAGVTYVIIRFSRRRFYDSLSHGAGAVERTLLAGIARGALRGLVALAAMGAVFLVEAAVFDLDAPALAGPLLAVFVFALHLSRRSLLRWQNSNARIVCFRRGMGRFAWTSRGARDRLMTITSS